MADKLYYIVSDYFATGEGRCISMMIFRPEFDDEDYEVKPAWTNDSAGQWVFIEGKLKPGITEKVVALRKFIEEYGDWYGQGAEIVTRDELLSRFGSCVPEFVKNITNPEAGPEPWFEWKQQLYYNYS